MDAKRLSELFSALDYVDELIYVCDMDTYDLVYCNKALEGALLGEYQAGQPGCKCYKCLHGLNHPCSFCNMQTLRDEKQCVWSRVHPMVGKRFLIHDSLIPLDGKTYRLELAVDASLLDEASDAPSQSPRKSNAELYLADCVRHLARSADYAGAIAAVLQTVLNYFGADRAYIFEFSWSDGSARNTFEVCAPNVSAEIDNLQAVPLERMQRWVDLFNDDCAVVIEDLERMKADPQRRTEYEDLAVQGIRSCINVPITSDEGLIGCLGVDNPSINLDDADILVDLAYFLAVEIGKNHIVGKLRDQSYHDPLTGVYNREGFNRITEQVSAKDEPLAFLMLDIDHFKVINDTHGHAVGDEILKATATCLGSVFRADDAVFRLGGDEFAVLLRNCPVEAWNIICSKIQLVHASLSELHKEMLVTLSAGICFARAGYSKELYMLADDAMYQTKKNGRAGCTMIDERSGEKRYWKDETLSAHGRFALSVNDTGLYRIEYPLDGQTPPRMICGADVRKIFAFPADADAETCYALWLGGIEPSYVEVLADTRQLLLGPEQAECTYQWRHPEHGLIFIRSNAIGEIEGNVQVLYGYHHSMKDTHIVERADESRLLLEAISSIYYGSYYIDLDNDVYKTIKYAPNERFLHVTEADAQQSLLGFVSVLARKSDHEKMNAFVDLSTLPQRMQNETHLDCEYFAVKEDRWCRATFIPVKRHADGCLSHVLFEVTPLDFAQAMEADESAQNRKTIESLYDHIPGGLVMYEYDGSKLKMLHASRFYGEIYGITQPISADGREAGPNFGRIHPDDREGFRQAIKEALFQTGQLEYVYRGWNNKKNDYVWIKTSGVSEAQEDGTLLVYAMFSDITPQKEAELQLAKKHASLMAALSASHQLCYEYDPSTHVQECLTEDQVFYLPRVIQNYPEAVLDIIHPDNRQTFLDAVHAMESGKQETSCTIQLLRDGDYVWYAYHFQSVYDPGRARPIVLISVMDDSEHMTTIGNYQARMNIMMGSADDALACILVNLSQNTFSVIRSGEKERSLAQKLSTLDDFISAAAAPVVGTKERECFKKRFSRRNLIDLMKKGQMHVQMEHMYRTRAQGVEWIRTCVDMLYNPSSGEYVGVFYTKSIQKEKISGVLLESTLQSDYAMAAIVEARSDRYYLFDPDQGAYCVAKDNFWDDIASHLETVVDGKDVHAMEQTLQKELVLGALDAGEVFSHSFGCMHHGGSHRLEAKFSYIDESKELFLATLRDITDSVIMEQLRHDNERDYLTDLYNRRKVFAECEQLLAQHPDDQFAMLHFDIRHFRLYNTFFGDAAGDKLLCDIADIFRGMDKDYEYWAYGRIEADVFCVFFPINQNKYQKHLDDLLNSLQGYRSDFLIEPTIGIYVVDDKSMPMESMFTRASIAAKTIKSGVTDSVVFFDEAMEQSLISNQQVINDMNAALEQEQFKVYFQPQYSLKTKQLIGAEALVRWLHPQKGLISPDAFVPVFEGNGFIAKLDRYVWESVCRMLRAWQDSGQAIVPVSVNVSRISMYSPTTVQYLKDLVAAYQVEPKYLELELTESAYMDDPDEMKKQLRELQEYGFSILMDDFGSGYSSLNVLRELPVDVLKLDKEFLSESTGDQRGKMVLTSVVTMADLLDLDVLAEGVETAEQEAFLEKIGCDYVQGYLYARPMPMADFERVLAQAQA